MIIVTESSCEQCPFYLFGVDDALRKSCDENFMAMRHIKKIVQFHYCYCLIRCDFKIKMLISYLHINTRVCIIWNAVLH